MICYRDMTFCDGNKGQCLAFNDCPRKLTEKIKQDAEKAGLYICKYMCPAELGCYDKGIKREQR